MMINGDDIGEETRRVYPSIDICGPASLIKDIETNIYFIFQFFYFTIWYTVCLILNLHMCKSTIKNYPTEFKKSLLTVFFIIR